MITNLGNTCYLGSALECIIRTTSMDEYIRLQDRQTRREAILYYKVHTTVRNGEICDPKELYMRIMDFYKPFQNRGQHDAHEAFLVILEYLREYMDPIPNTMYSVGTREGVRAWGDRYSIVDEIYKLQFENIIRCTRCRHEILQYECTYGIYDTFTGLGAHPLPGYKCDHCQGIDTCLEHVSIAHYPPTLVVRVKEENQAQSVAVIGTKVYSLFAMCRYLPAGKDRGHYNAAFKDSRTEQWTLVDDDTEHPIDFATLRKHASVLFYSRVEQGVRVHHHGLDDGL